MLGLRVVLPMLVLSGSALGPNFKHAEPEPALATLGARTVGDAHTTSAPVPEQWWSAFGDPVLSALEQRAIAGNLDLRIAAARVERGRAALRVAGASLLPTMGAGASYLRERSSPNGILALSGGAQPGPAAADGTDPLGVSSLPGKAGSSAFSLFPAGFDASWEIDLWGKARKTREAARADAAQLVYEREAARVSLTAEVARTYVGLRGDEAHLDVLRSNRETVTRGLAIARSREANGAASRYDAATAEAQLATIEAEIPAVRCAASGPVSRSRSGWTCCPVSRSRGMSRASRPQVASPSQT